MLSGLQGIQDSAKKFMADNSTTILTAGGVVGTVATAVLTGRATLKASEILLTEKFEYDPEKNDVKVNQLTKTEVVLKVWPLYIPPVVMGGVTITSIIMAHRMSAQKAAAMAALYGLSQKQFEEYKTKVTEKLTGPKSQQIKDELAQERADKTPGAQTIIIVGDEVLCFDELTGRYFKSTMEQIRKAVNDTNEEILHHDGASASFFYNLLGLPATAWTDDVGWNTDNLLDIEYSTIRSYDDRPCISINPKFLPYAGYNRHTY